MLVNHLSCMYRAPAAQDLWKNDQFESDGSKWGFAVSIGFLTRMVTWRQKETGIVLKMEGGNHEIFISIRYANQ